MSQRSRLRGRLDRHHGKQSETLIQFNESAFTSSIYHWEGN